MQNKMGKKTGLKWFLWKPATSNGQVMKTVEEQALTSRSRI
jgi:phage-related protein